MEPLDADESMRMLASVRWARCARGAAPQKLEADELDDRLASGWSVVVLGQAEQVEEPAEFASLFRRLGQPWAPDHVPWLFASIPLRWLADAS